MDSYNAVALNSALALKRMDRAAAASRQKSCNACVRGKRKCDKRTPKCTRCAVKGLDCVYQRTPSGASGSQQQQQGQQQGQQHLHQQQQQQQQQQPDIGLTPSVVDIPDFDMDFDLETLGNDTTPDSLQSDVHLQLDPHLEFSIMDLMNDSMKEGSQLWNLHDYTPKMDIPPVLTRQPIRDLTLYNENDECMSFNPLDIYDNRTRIGYVVEFISTMHRTFAQTRCLPFLHPRLYGSSLPRPILSAFCACTAYTSCTPQTKGWVMKLIADTARDIHREGERADTPHEKLARVQALVLLDTIRLFDGDVTLRAAAEREMAQMTLWADSLTEVRRELEREVDLTVPARERPPKAWEDWILLESVKRTGLMVCSFICLTAMLKSIEPPADLFNSEHNFTASRHLWEADSSLNFFRAWNEKPQYIINDMGFKDFWSYGRPEDVDDFTKLMLTAQAGPDALDHFMTGPTIIPTA